MGPPPVISSFPPPFPFYRVSSIHPSSSIRMAFSSSHHPLIACHASRSFPHQSLTRKRDRFSSFPHPPGCPPPWIILFRPSLSTIVLLATPFTLPRRHHSCPTPCPPCWPLGLTLNLFSCSRCQREKSSLFRGAELVWPLSIPRSSY
jgi:hypothetical protein